MGIMDSRRGAGYARAAAAILLACLCVTAACTSPTRGERALDADLVRTIDEIVATPMAAGLIPGAEVAIVDPEQGTYNVGRQ